MRYPKGIYRTFEIVEKEILGEKYYGLVRVYNILGFKFKKHIKVCRCGAIGYVGGFDARKWWDTKYTIEDVIRSDNSDQEYKFKKRMTK